MKLGNLFLQFVMGLLSVGAFALEATAAEISPEIREQVIQEIVQESRTGNPPIARRKWVLRGSFEGKRRQLVLKSADEAQLKRHLNLPQLESQDQRKFLNTRSMALAGLSAGGILYFFPGQKFFFWEISEDAHLESDLRKDIWTSPVLANILSGLLKNLQRDLKSKKRLLGSKKMSSFMMVLLNPSDFIARKLWGQGRGNRGSTEVLTESPIPQDSTFTENTATRTNYIGLQFKLRF